MILKRDIIQSMIVYRESLLEQLQGEDDCTITEEGITVHHHKAQVSPH